MLSRQRRSWKNDDLKILDDPFELEEYAIALKKDNTELKDKINAALAELKEDGTLDSIASNYIGDDTKENLRMNLRQTQTAPTENW